MVEGEGGGKTYREDSVGEILRVRDMVHASVKVAKWQNGSCQFCSG